jgi:hypothetical protein
MSFQASWRYMHWMQFFLASCEILKYLELGWF